MCDKNTDIENSYKLKKFICEHHEKLIEMHGELEVTYRGAFPGLMGLVNDIKISDGTLMDVSS